MVSSRPSGRERDLTGAAAREGKGGSRGSAGGAQGERRHSGAGMLRSVLRRRCRSPPARLGGGVRCCSSSCRSSEDPLPLPLEGVRVLEFTHAVMGPTAGLVLADLGATVIKVEPPQGDRTRHLQGVGVRASSVGVRL